MFKVVSTLRNLLTGVLLCPLLLACSQEPEVGAVQQSDRTVTDASKQSGDVVARVGDQPIHFSELNTMLNSSAVIGISIPALGTPKRDTVRITLLDKMVSANLMYLDAKRQGADEDPEYQRAMQRFSNAMLADAYVRDYLERNVQISEEDRQAYYDRMLKPDAELTDELRAVMDAKLRKEKIDMAKAALKQELREGTEIRVFGTEVYPEEDDERDADTPIAKYGDEVITWGEVKNRMIAAGRAAVKRDPVAMESDARLSYLQNEIDTRLLAQKAREAGLDQEAKYRERYDEYAKTRLINLHRQELAAEIDPDEEELQAYFEANRKRITEPEYRKVQMVMLETEDEAKAIRQQVEEGEITMFQAAADHSVAPDAEQNLGEIGWVADDTLRPALDELVFTLAPGEVGGPVEAGGLWHIMLVQDVRDAQNTDLEEERTRKLARRMYVHEKLDEYVRELRKNVFNVEVYEDVIIRLAQQEADMVRELSEQAESEGSVTKTRLEELQRFIDSGGGEDLQPGSSTPGT